MILVIGSGPAGVTAATALLERGYCVTMLDVGLMLDSGKEKILADVKKDPEYMSLLRQSLDTRIPIKLSYGSDYVYREVFDYFQLKKDQHIHYSPSFAQGGLSNVWGAFVDRYCQEDLQTWPLEVDALTPYYDKTYQLLSATNRYRGSQQAEVLLSHFEKNNTLLQQAGFSFGRPLLAVRFNDAKYPCNYCGACQHGCPFELIYTASHTLQTLLKHPQFTYVNNVVVQDIQETEQQVKVIGVDRETKEQLSFNSTQVFVACGAIISTVLMLKTLKHSCAQFLDSTHFMLPCLMHTRVSNVTKEKLHTLCQLFLRLRHTEISSKTINLQIYTYMDYYTERFKRLFKGLYPLVQSLLKPFLNRMIVIQGHLDAEDSHQFVMHYEEATLSTQSVSVLNPRVNIVMKQLLRYLKKHRKELGFTPIRPMLHISKITKAYHYGGSMPMRQSPKEFETDLWGRPSGLQRIHVVDASIFPTIPAGSITPTIMANAYRIAAECPL